MQHVAAAVDVKECWCHLNLENGQPATVELSAKIWLQSWVQFNKVPVYSAAVTCNWTASAARCSWRYCCSSERFGRPGGQHGLTPCDHCAAQAKGHSACLEVTLQGRPFLRTQLLMSLPPWQWLRSGRTCIAR